MLWRRADPGKEPPAPSSRASILGATACVVGMVAAVLGFALSRAHHQSLSDARDIADQLARSAEQQTHRTVLSIDATLLGLVGFLNEGYSDAAIDGPEVRSLLRLVVQQTFPIRDIVVVDGSGRQVNSGFAGGGGPTLDHRQREFFKHGAGEALFISLPELSPRSGTRSVAMSRYVVLANGFSGYLVAEVPIESFTDFFNAINSPNAARIALLRSDGHLLATEPREERLIGERLLAADALRDRLARGSRIGETSSFSGAPAIVTYRRVPARPLVIEVSLDMQRALAVWRADRNLYLVIFGAVVLASLGVAARLIRLTDRRRRAELAEIEAQSRLQRAVEGMSDAFALFDSADHLLLWNAKYIAFFPHLRDVIRPGVAFETLVDQAASAAPLSVSPEERAAWRSWRLEQHRNPGGGFEQEFADGRVFHTVVRKTDGGETVVVIRDISDLKRVERAARQAQEAAEAASRLKSAFLANMSHELRTPLNAIIGFADIIKGGLFGEHQRYKEYATDIHQAGTHLLALVNDILDLSKIETGAMTLREDLADIAAIVESSLDLVRTRAGEGKVELRAEIQPDLPWIFVDELRLKQIVLNLVSNAVKYTPPGGSITAGAALDAERCMVIRVADTGIGMRPEDIPVALQDFRQIDASLSRQFEGTGLGLPLAKRLAELHGGTLTVDSEVGAGTTVTVRLPPWRSGDARKAALG